jgi:hypothetical protein
MFTAISGVASITVIVGFLCYPIKQRRKYENVVTRVFDEYEHNTHTNQVDKPHYEPNTTRIALLLGVTKSKDMQDFNKNNSEWWTRYSRLRELYNTPNGRDLIVNVCDKCKVSDHRKFLKWVEKQDSRERRKRKRKAIKHNKTLDIYSGYKLEYPAFDYNEFMC